MSLMNELRWRWAERLWRVSRGRRRIRALWGSRMNEVAVIPVEAMSQLESSTRQSSVASRYNLKPWLHRGLWLFQLFHHRRVMAPSTLIARSALALCIKSAGLGPVSGRARAWGVVVRIIRRRLTCVWRRDD